MIRPKIHLEENSYGFNENDYSIRVSVTEEQWEFLLSQPSNTFGLAKMSKLYDTKKRYFDLKALFKLESTYLTSQLHLIQNFISGMQGNEILCPYFIEFEDNLDDIIFEEMQKHFEIGELYIVKYSENPQYLYFLHKTPHISMEDISTSKDVSQNPRHVPFI